MAIENGYCILSEIKSWCGVTDAQDDPSLRPASRRSAAPLMRCAGAIFYHQRDAGIAPEEDGKVCFVEDVIAITELRTDDNGDGVYDCVGTRAGIGLNHSTQAARKPYLD